MSTKTTTASSDNRRSQSPPGLRRRMHILHRTSSLHGSGTRRKTPVHNSSSNIDYKEKGGENETSRPDDVEEPSPLEPKHRFDSSDDELDYVDQDTSYEAIQSLEKDRHVSVDNQPTGHPQEIYSNPTRGPPARPQLDTASLSVSPQASGTSGSRDSGPRSPASSKTWYEFDLAVVVALVSPIGNWLTGGDHIKNLLLVVLLIFYLHQIIEIPWTLYQKARPRRRGLPLPPASTDSPKTRYAHLAATELRRLELFFLFLTLVSPFLGALLLRYGTASVLGDAAVSWFSTGLFVLATGMRPWRHLVDRLQTRTAELHDFIHYPEMCFNSEDAKESEKRHRQERQQQIMQEEIAELRRKVEKLEKGVKKMRGEVVHCNEELAEYVESGMAAAIQKQELKWDKYEGRVKGLEHVVKDIQLRGIGARGGKDATRVLIQFKEAFLAALHWVVELGYTRKIPAGQKRRTSLSNQRRRASSTGSLTDTLETIVEEDDAKSRSVAEDIPSPERHSSRKHHRSSKSTYGILTLPLRAVVRMVVRSETS
ncbi:hypothetical protein CC1G_02162 [Coprinopsis cinerea okayama7|uniref:Uncharacterized protein n=1 Tax=Coprinopsis cinerea (strain Okayama-7 / 130 / ATCC MYA-4618 / FGSC 9003) TaxID=240176 RepID=A8NKE5_COPC7|nr:hypothetical protein CC1G_02162 [Coprinopsis cinerea okayama7\|eukprot:XP_001834426.2 hypothetical protein CC1G_02162 [Coprinopsis cinerea okayama7\